MLNKQRFSYTQLSKDAFAGFLQVKAGVEEAGTLSPILIAMLELRVSLLNGCSYCIHLHSEELAKLGAKARFIHEIAAWQCSHGFDEKESAALRWADSLTKVSETHIPDEDFALVKAHFSDAEISDMAMIISNMNAMNRIAIAARR